MKKISTLIIVSTFAFVAFNNLPSPMSSGAPAQSTGAPDEKDCTTSGCHSDFKVNTGTAVLSISAENGITQYEPGKTYAITVSISDPGLVRFEFQVLALRNSDHANVGTIKLTDLQRTQIIDGYGALASRKYVTYTYPGTDAVSSGLGRWTFSWTAPETNEGAVTLYAASIAANDDGTDTGDHTYTKQLTLAAPSTEWSIFPSVSSGEFHLAQVEGIFSVYNSSGQKIYSASSPKSGLLDLSANQTGVYFISVSHEGKTEYKKIVISR